MNATKLSRIRDAFKTGQTVYAYVAKQDVRNQTAAIIAETLCGRDDEIVAIACNPGDIASNRALYLLAGETWPGCYVVEADNESDAFDALADWEQPEGELHPIRIADIADGYTSESEYDDSLAHLGNYGTPCDIESWHITKLRDCRYGFGGLSPRIRCEAWPQFEVAICEEGK